jgi:hypothetical protein
MGPVPPLFRPCQQRIGSWPCRKRCLLPTSAADFCCHEHPRASSSRACGLRRTVRRDLPCAPAGACARAATRDRPRRCRIAVAGISDPEWPLQLTLRRPAAAAFTVPRGVPAGASLDLRPRCRRGTNPVRRPLTPPVAPRRRPVARAAPRRPGSALPMLRQEHRLPEPRAPSTDRSRRALPRARARSVTLRAATATPAWPPEWGFRHAFTHILVR